MNARIFWIALLIIVFPFNARGQGKIRGFYDALPPEMKRPSTHVPRMEVVMGLQKVDHGITEIGIDMRGGLGFEGNHTIAIIGIDGSLEYYGPDKSAHILGPHSGSVNQRILNKLCQLIVASGFMDMDNNYSHGPTDGDVTYTMVLCNGKRKVVRNYFGSGPSKLWAIEQLIQKLIDGALWYKPVTKLTAQSTKTTQTTYNASIRFEYPKMPIPFWKASLQSSISPLSGTCTLSINPAIYREYLRSVAKGN